MTSSYVDERIPLSAQPPATVQTLDDQTNKAVPTSHPYTIAIAWKSFWIVVEVSECCFHRYRPRRYPSVG
jgi:hypothetical protein